ncbi:hypothetical protein BXZ70DRAFT_918969 [Cristinia sonorae]|uniref:Uncharacterized protein n=1 Tax=Cristinia sonorae TaxID=1940300 RepID=A0A8K0UWV1_9AGAR|nr:hypothetical protein BXZ70DRAFT_918969 [Cristinia sonorae]
MSQLSVSLIAAHIRLSWASLQRGFRCPQTHVCPSCPQLTRRQNTVLSTTRSSHSDVPSRGSRTLPIHPITSNLHHPFQSGRSADADSTLATLLFRIITLADSDPSYQGPPQFLFRPCVLKSTSFSLSYP